MKMRCVSTRWLALIAPLAVLTACRSDSADGESDPGRVAMTVGEVYTFDVTEMEGCEPDEDEQDKVTCLHLDQEVVYEHTPPVGGMHAPVFQDCDFYDEPVYNEGAVHSLEHGAVWITFDPDLADDQVDHIRLLAQDPKVLASPWDLDELPAPIVLSAWGAQLAVTELPDEAATRFVADAAGSSAAPKPDAECSGGFAGTRANPR